MKVALVYNRKSGRGRSKDDLLPGVVSRLEGAGMKVSPAPTEKMGHATLIAKEAAKAGYDIVIAWGGDGTLNEVACGLFETPTALGVLPGGTVNVFAREVGIPLKLGGAIDALVGGRVTRIPMGLAGERPFLLMAGVGLDGEVVYQLKAGFKSALGAMAFWLDGFRLLASYPMTPLRIETEGREIVGTGVIAGNIRRYGPHYKVTPDAKLDEPKLDVVVFKGKNRRDYLRYLVGVIGQFHLKFGDIDHFKTDALTIHVDGGGRVPYQLDGEPAGYAPLVIGVRDQALAVVLPSI